MEDTKKAKEIFSHTMPSVANDPTFDTYETKVYEGAVAILVKKMSDYAYEAHCAALPGTHGIKVYRCLRRAISDFAAATPALRVLVGFVPESNTRAKRINEKMGFNVTGRIDNFFGDSSMLVMCKEM